MLAYLNVMVVFLPFCLAEIQIQPSLSDIYNVTLAVFSGMPDPVWTISASQISNTLDSVKSYDPMKMPARLGFRGFVLQGQKKDARLIVGPETMALQQQLLETMPKDLLQGAIIEEIKKDIKTVAVKVDTVMSKRNAPPYEPALWNTGWKKQICNNCYNYANNKPTDTVAQPGYANAYLPYLDETQEYGPAVREAAQRDGLILMNNFMGPDVNPVDPGPNVKKHVVALVARPGPRLKDRDFHWYRFDANDKWSHKPGSAPVTNLDNKDQEITDPRKADRGGYTEFLGFMYSGENVNIAGSQNACKRRLLRFLGFTL